MLVAAHTGSSPGEIVDNWTMQELEDFIACLPFIRRFGHPLYGGEDAW